MNHELKIPEIVGLLVAYRKIVDPGYVFFISEYDSSGIMTGIEERWEPFGGGGMPERAMFFFIDLKDQRQPGVPSDTMGLATPLADITLASQDFQNNLCVCLRRKLSMGAK